MKAKEYAERFIDTDGPEEAMKLLGQCGVDFCNEFVAMAKSRKISTDIGLANLIDEFDNKFRKFGVLVSQIYPNLVDVNGFLNLLKEYSPDALVLYKTNKPKAKAKPKYQPKNTSQPGR